MAKKKRAGNAGPKMVEVVLNQTSAGPEGILQRGRKVTVDEAVAKTMIASGQASPVRDEAIERAVDDSPRETANKRRVTVDPPPRYTPPPTRVPEHTNDEERGE